MKDTPHLAESSILKWWQVPPQALRTSEAALPRSLGFTKLPEGGCEERASETETLDS